MKTAYLDCQSGVSGDMFLAACVDAGADFDTIQRGIDSLNTGNCQLEQKEVKKFGFRALKIDVLHEPEHAHRHLHHINQMIDDSQITVRQKEIAKAIFLNLAKAEAKVHGSTLEKVHFHEVGAIDSIADIVGGAIAWDLLGVDQLICSPVPTGKGQIKIAHGIVSVPAPATAELLKGIPLLACDIEAELTTPTGAAIVSTLATQFGALPGMQIDRIGIGAGTRELDEQANVLRLLIGNQDQQTASDTVMLLETNLDDANPEWIGYCQQKLWEAGALDVYTTAIQMKKNRPGVLLSVICAKEKSAELQELMLIETGTLGVRRQVATRAILPREPHQVETEWGPVSGKRVTLPNGQQVFTAEFEDCAEIAQQHKVSIRAVYLAAEYGFAKQQQN